MAHRNIPGTEVRHASAPQRRVYITRLQSSLYISINLVQVLCSVMFFRVNSGNMYRPSVYVCNTYLYKFKELPTGRVTLAELCRIILDGAPMIAGYHSRIKDEANLGHNCQHISLIHSSKIKTTKRTLPERNVVTVSTVHMYFRYTQPYCTESKAKNFGAARPPALGEVVPGPDGE